MFNCTIKMVNGEFLVISCNNWLPIDGVFQKAEGEQQPQRRQIPLQQSQHKDFGEGGLEGESGKKSLGEGEPSKLESKM